MDAITIRDLFDLTHSRAGEALSTYTYPWEALPHITEIVLAVGAALDPERYDHPQEDVWIAKTAKVYPTASIDGPCVIGENTEVRPGAFLRGSILVGDGAVVGNSSELKNCILFDGVQVPHYNYVGDSILGYKAHMGAGSITSNLKSDKTIVYLGVDGEKICTNRKKLGAILGDNVEVGCNSVLNPGTVIGKNTTVYPVSMVRGYVPENSIYKFRDDIVEKIESEEE